ncbi:MAG: response regulator [Lachnospiraceae bacterium]|nr:response regulator [Lachnospiraceae bacterium]
MPFMQFVVTIREELACLLVLSYIAWTYFAVEREKTYAHQLFTYMLGVSIVNVILDAITIYTVNHRDTIADWINHGLHILYIGSFPIFLWIVYLYIKCLAFQIKEHRITMREILPVIVAFFAVAILPMYYVESDFSDYSTGPADTVAYICAFVYFVLSVRLLIRYRNVMDPKARRGIALALGGLVSVVVAQAIVHQLLMTGIGITLINVALYYTVESPDAILIEKLALEKERADEANKAKSSFLAHMSHEIRTPINSVLGMDEMILRESKEENIQEYAENIKVAGNTLLSLINDILDFSKVEAGKMEIIPAQYELSSLINDLYNMTCERAQRKSLRLIMDVDENIPNILYGDEIRIKQCALNIMTNAVKYTRKGSVTVSVGYERLDADNIMLDITVKDTGIGMKPEALEELFVPFARIEEKKNRNIEGTGLGMNITRQLLQLMGSDIRVKSTYGEGSEVSFSVKQGVVAEVPIGKSTDLYKSAQPERSVHMELFHAPEAKVLVVDDNDMNHMVISNLLKRTRVQVTSAFSGAQALDMIGKGHYDMYFIDHMMPEMDGIELLQRLREKEEGKDAVCIALTANAVSGAREMYLQAGFQDYLSKPVDNDKLEMMLMKYLPEELIEAPDSGSEPETSGKDTTQVSDIEGLDVAKGIENCSDEETFLSVLEVFYETIEERAGELEASFGKKDWAAYRIQVHSLKSSARTIGATGLADTAEMLEKAAAAGNEQLIVEKNDDMLKRYRAYTENLAKLFS